MEMQLKYFNKKNMLVVKKFVFNPFSVNTYLIWDESSKECLIIDPGCSSANEEQQLKSYITDNHLRVLYMLNTHCHIDHIMGCNFINDQYEPEYYIPEKDIDLLSHAQTQASAFGLEIKRPPLPDILISENTQLKIGNSPVTFLFTPGHTAGEYCFYFKKQAICVTGDVLFRSSIGRTDLWGGDYDTLITSIRTQLFTLPDNVLIYPGHGDSSKIGLEKTDNPFLHETNKNYN